MNTPRNAPAAAHQPGWYRRFLVALVLTAAALDVAAGSPADSLSDADKTCLGCHAMDGMAKALEDGKSLSLHIAADAFAKSVHKAVGCAGCHSQVKLPDHPGNVKPIQGVREYALAQTEICSGCHDRIYKTWQGSLHAQRAGEGILAAATCADCHKPHQVSPASVQDGPRNACLGCHSTTLQTHQKWLPNAGRHLEAVACSACHAPDALRKLDLRFIDNATLQRLVDSDSTGFDKRARAADSNGDGLDATELRSLLAQFNRDGEKVSFRGHIELRTGMEAHELPLKESAVRDCVTCHDQRAAPFQRVTVSVLDADGRPVRYDAHSDVLTSVYTMDALSGFYAVGGTRIGMLDILLALGLAGGISVPALHLLVRRFIKRRAKKNGDSA